MGMTLDWAIAKKLRTDNPAKASGPLKFLLPTVRKSERHHPALPYSKTPAFMSEWRAMQSVCILTPEEQTTVYQATRTPSKVTWPAWWTEIGG
jgi:hypothetical protein